MIISNKNVYHPDVSFNGTVLERVYIHKHLGLIINKKLSWTEHVNGIFKSSSKMLDVTRKLKYQLDRTSLDTVYCSFIRPKLEYASQIWDDCNDGDAIKFQLAAAGVVTGAKKEHLMICYIRKLIGIL